YSIPSTSTTQNRQQCSLIFYHPSTPLYPYLTFIFFFFFFNDPATTEIYTLSLHDALPISQAVRRHAHARPGERAHRLAAGLDDAGEALRSVDKAALPGGGCGAAEPAVRVEGRQQRESDSGVAGGRDDTAGELARIRERHPGLVVVQVVEFSDVREAPLEHLRERQRADRLELVRIDMLDEAVDELTPAPEAVVPGSAALGQPGKTPLEGVAVHVGKTGQRNRMALICGRRCRVLRNALDVSVGGAQAHAPRPTLRQQRRFKPQ